MTLSQDTLPVGIAELRAELLAGRLTPIAAVRRACAALARLDSVVISWVPEETMVALADPNVLDRPLGGVPFAIKDNIDMAGVGTTAGCPSYRYIPAASATVVERLIAAGAIPVAKTNLDQFATGLVGTRSPYGTPINPFDAARVPGGSSSGSAVAVACGAVPFALGTDTAGSGRVPAAFNGIVGLKPTPGWISARGVVPAVRTVDCVSVFALSVEDAWSVVQASAGFDPADDYSRPPGASRRPHRPLRVGVVDGTPLDLADLPAVEAFGCGLEILPVDISAMQDAGRLLYGGPIVAERLAAVGGFLRGDHAGVDPIVRDIILAAERWTAADAAASGYELAHLRRRAQAVWDDVDVVVHPTVPGHPSLADVTNDPIGVNAELGAFTTFTNLLDLCAVAVPVGVTGGLPVSVSVLAPAWADRVAGELASAVHLATGGLRGATGRPLRGSSWSPPPSEEATVDVAVVGAHLRGQPLHHQIAELGGRFVLETRTTPEYRLYALPDTNPPKPGLVRVGAGDGTAIEVEVFRLAADAFARFVAAVPPPLCIGTVNTLGGPVSGFLCEPIAIEHGIDISHFGGWRSYRDHVAFQRAVDKWKS
jgi:allophanate hydrolase